MRTPFGKLVSDLVHEPGTTTIGDLARKYHEPPERIADALETVKLLYESWRAAHDRTHEAETVKSV